MVRTTPSTITVISSLTHKFAFCALNAMQTGSVVRSRIPNDLEEGHSTDPRTAHHLTFAGPPSFRTTAARFASGPSICRWTSTYFIGSFSNGGDGGVGTLLSLALTSCHPSFVFASSAFDPGTSALAEVVFSSTAVVAACLDSSTVVSIASS